MQGHRAGVNDDMARDRRGERLPVDRPAGQPSAHLSAGGSRRRAFSARRCADRRCANHIDRDVDDTRRRPDSRRTNRWAALFTLPFLTLIVVVIATARLVGDDGTTAAVVVGIWVGLAAPATVGVVGLTRAHRRRKANIAPYKQAYEKVAHAVVHGGVGNENRSTVDDER